MVPITSIAKSPSAVRSNETVSIGEIVPWRDDGKLLWQDLPLVRHGVKSVDSLYYIQSYLVMIVGGGVLHLGTMNR